MSTTPEFNEAQLLSARAAAWHQAGEPILTLEAARDWVNNYGLVLFAPHATTLGAPAPSLVEATLGEANPAPSAAQTETALGLLARLVAEGSAVPLNLLGGAGDVPDFVASAQVFSFCYTLRGDKAWKQAPAQTGAVKVSPLSLRVFEVLTERGSLTASALATELGREVTVSATTRALGELWGQMRVLPRRDPEGMVWELTTQRFTKVIKAGSNAGLPKALSALVSLYLHQAMSASEGEVESFLSPLTARSRIREVVHALTSARELETVVLDGKTLLYVADALPEFAPAEPMAEAIAPEASTEGAEQSTAQRRPAAAERSNVEGSSAEGSGKEGRISKFKGAGARGGDLRGKPFRSAPGRKTTGGAFGRADRSRPGAEGRGSSDRPARPARPRTEGDSRSAGSRAGGSAGFQSGSRPAGRSDQPSTFSRPWDEERGARPGASESRPSGSSEGRPARPFRARADGDAPRPYRPRTEGDAPRPLQAAPPKEKRPDRIDRRVRRPIVPVKAAKNVAPLAGQKKALRVGSSVPDRHRAAVPPRSVEMQEIGRAAPERPAEARVRKDLAPVRLARREPHGPSVGRSREKVASA